MMKHRIPSLESMLLYKDDDLAVINKPPLISSLEDRVHEINILKIARKEYADAQLCHRLDKETSGILLIALHPAAYRHVSKQFEKRKVYKEYHAVCDGLHDFKNVKVDQPLMVTSNGLARVDARNGKSSKTVFNSLKAFRNHTLISCEPITGRMHQIRVHLAFLHAPVTGDLTYGGKPFFLSSVKKNYNIGKYEEERPLIQRLALHAFRIKFQLLSGEYMEFEAPYPKDLRVLLLQLEKNT